MPTRFFLLKQAGLAQSRPKIYLPTWAVCCHQIKNFPSCTTTRKSRKKHPESHLGLFSVDLTRNRKKTLPFLVCFCLYNFTHRAYRHHLFFVIAVDAPRRAQGRQTAVFFVKEHTRSGVYFTKRAFCSIFLVPLKRLAKRCKTSPPSCWERSAESPAGMFFGNVLRECPSRMFFGDSSAVMSPVG